MQLLWANMKETIDAIDEVAIHSMMKYVRPAVSGSISSIDYVCARIELLRAIRRAAVV